MSNHHRFGNTSVSDSASANTEHPESLAWMDRLIAPIRDAVDTNAFRLRDLAGAGLLIIIWLALAWARWGRWGDVTVDCGREAYVPWMLSKGKQLYTDVWYLYGPTAPYLNSLLFRVFGPYLQVLYWAGLSALLAEVLALYASGVLLGSRLAPVGAGAVVLLESVRYSLFCYPWAYSFSAVYGSVLVAFFFMVSIIAVRRRPVAWVLTAGLLAGLALATKLEQGAACYCALAVVLALRWYAFGWRRHLLKDLVATTPGIALCAAITAWMFSLRGVDFILKENFMSWPTSYFMVKFGRAWLASTGLSTTPTIMIVGLVFSVLFLCFWFGAREFIRGVLQNQPRRQWVGPLALALWSVVPVLATLELREAINMFVSPRPMPVILCLVLLLLAAGLYRKKVGTETFPLVAAIVVAVLEALRILFHMSFSLYPIFYNGPTMLVFLVVMHRLLAAAGGERLRRLGAGLTVVFIAVVILRVVAVSLGPGNPVVPFWTQGGFTYIDTHKAPAYREALDVMEAASAKGESVMSLPEDTSLYFMARVPCPTRVFAATPGLISPGNMTSEFLAQMQKARPRYLLISDRKFPEYHAPVFGVDFAVPIGDYIRSNYHAVRQLAPNDPATAEADWHVWLWERTNATPLRKGFRQ